jgi:hypothetical protein
VRRQVARRPTTATEHDGQPTPAQDPWIAQAETWISALREGSPTP